MRPDQVEKLKSLGMELTGPARQLSHFRGGHGDLKEVRKLVLRMERRSNRKGDQKKHGD